MPTYKVAIIEDNPDKSDVYAAVIEAAGHQIVARITNLDEVAPFLDHFSDNPDTTPDVVLVDGTLDEKKAADFIRAQDRAATFGRSIGNLVLDGERIATEIIDHRTPEYAAWVAKSQASPRDETLSIFDLAKGTLGVITPSIQIPEGSIIPEHVRVIGIASIVALRQADVPHATPTEVIDYLASFQL